MGNIVIAAAANGTACSGCGTLVASGLLACPSCHKLTHGDELKELSLRAEAKASVSDYVGALQEWRRALELLPPDSRQFTLITEKVTELTKLVDQQPASERRTAEEVSKTVSGSEHKSGTAKGLAAGAGAVGLLLWKFKFIAVFLLTKAKLLFLGLTKASTFFSMMLSMSLYWTIWGWKFALGLVLSIYVHEMGHVAKLRKYGVRAGAPLFIPGLGAVVRLKQHFSNPREDARVGLAGPIWGLGAAVVAYGVFLATEWPMWAAVAKVGAWINLFNLLPIWQLDGGRGFHSLTRTHRWVAVACIVGMWFTTHESLLFLIAIAAGARAFGEGAKERDDTALIEYCFLIVALSLMTMIKVPGTAGMAL